MFILYIYTVIKVGSLAVKYKCCSPVVIAPLLIVNTVSFPTLRAR